MGPSCFSHEVPLLLFLLPPFTDSFKLNIQTMRPGHKHATKNIYIFIGIYIYISNKVLLKVLYLFLNLTKILTQVHSKSPAPTVQCRQLNN